MSIPTAQEAKFEFMGEYFQARDDENHDELYRLAAIAKEGDDDELAEEILAHIPRDTCGYDRVLDMNNHE